MAEGPIQKLTTGGQQMVNLVVEKYKSYGHSYLAMNHWLVGLLERYGPMAVSLVGNLDPTAVLKATQEKLGRNELGPALSAEEVAQLAAERASQRGKLQAAERDVAAVILLRAGYTIKEGTGFSVPCSAPAGGGEPIVGKSASPDTPTLNQFGRDLTEAARQGKLPPLVGRQEELAQVIETLCRRTKRNPVLVGPAGVGKTAIVEGVAALIVKGEVPKILQDVRLIAIQPSTLVAGAHLSGELEKRMQALVREASQPGIVLFIDEIHSIIGAGGMVGTTDMGSILKPSLARGELACIAATTHDEYRRFIESDGALERRFNPVRVQEPTAEQTLEIVRTLRDEMSKSSSIQMSDDVLTWLVEFADQYMRNRNFPDKAVDLMEQCFAHALAQSQGEVGLDEAREVAQRMVGMPLALDESLAQLKQMLSERALLGKSEAEALVDRLKVTMRGLDMRSSRPNAVLLLTAEVREHSETLAAVLAEAMYGNADRVITIDFSRFLHPEDVNLLVGAPPGYVGYSDTLPLHRLAQIPWCVLRFENVDSCHPYIRQVLSQAFKDGLLMDGRGRPMYLSDTIVLLSADLELHAKRAIGFFAEPEAIDVKDVEAAMAESLGGDLAGQVDLLLFGRQEAGTVSGEWVLQNLLGPLSKRYFKQGVLLEWDESLVNWLAQALSHGFGESDWEHWVDRMFTPQVIAYLPHHATQKVKVTVKLQNDTLVFVQNLSE
jgi:ATP-dependent Clp protease ATP-binding subunit ClpC